MARKRYVAKTEDGYEYIGTTGATYRIPVNDDTWTERLQQAEVCDVYANKWVSSTWLAERLPERPVTMNDEFVLKPGVMCLGGVFKLSPDDVTHRVNLYV